MFKKKTISIYMLVYKIEKVDSVLNKSSNCNTMFLNLLHCSVMSGWSLVFFYFFFPFISPKNGLAMGNILQGRPLRQFTSLKRIKSKSAFKINCHESHFPKMTTNSLKMSKTFKRS